MANTPYPFYAPARRDRGPRASAERKSAVRFAGGVAAAVRAFLLFALALPFADALYRHSTGLPLAATIAQPTYSYRAAQANPAAFAVWWYYYLNEWIREDGIRSKIDAPDPEKKLPFVLVPGSSGRMFDTTIRINNLGFRGPDLPRDKGDAFRIFALGELQTFGPTLRDGERPWPELLQDLFDRHADCGRKVEIVNAGTEAYTLEDNLERMRRDILPLKPNLILSTHGMNGLLALGLRRVPEPNEPGIRPRASRADRPRGADDRAGGPRLAKPKLDRAAPGGARADDGRRIAQEPLRRRLSQADRARARGRRGRRARRCEHGDQREEPARGQGLLRRGVQADR